MTAAVALVVTLLTASALAYLVACHGFLVRARAHRRVPRLVLDEYFSGSMPTVTVLVPSYREDARVMIDGIGWAAKWWTRDEEPGGYRDESGQSPWSRIEEPGSSVQLDSVRHLGRRAHGRTSFGRLPSGRDAPRHLRRDQ